MVSYVFGLDNPWELVMITVGFILLWVVVSVPVYFAGKKVTAGKSTFSDAMIASLFGPITYAATFFAFNYFLGAVVYSWSLFLAFVIWVWVFKASFKTSWLGALALSIFAIFVFVALSLIFAAVHGIVTPAPFFPQI